MPVKWMVGSYMKLAYKVSFTRPSAKDDTTLNVLGLNLFHPTSMFLLVTAQELLQTCFSLLLLNRMAGAPFVLKSYLWNHLLFFPINLVALVANAPPRI